VGAHLSPGVFKLALVVRAKETTKKINRNAKQVLDVTRYKVKRCNVSLTNEEKKIQQLYSLVGFQLSFFSNRQITLAMSVFKAFYTTAKTHKPAMTTVIIAIPTFHARCAKHFVQTLITE
jgi:uncharacterized membrane protein YqjE